MRKQRETNIEMLRIVAMLFILIVHADGASLGLPLPKSASWAAADWGKTLVESVSVIGVNLFVLISGYFGIKLTKQRLLAYLGLCAFYSVGIYFVECLLHPASLTWAKAIRAVLFVSLNDLWFVREYLFLMLLSPLINNGLSRMSNRELNYLVIGTVVISCYFGWLWHCKVNPTGYTLMQMVTIYICGHWLHRHTLRRSLSLMVYIAALGCIVVSARFIPSQMAYAYNSPFVMIASMAFFSIFASMKPAYNATINKAAMYTFAVYLIHKNPYVWLGVFKPTMLSIYKHYSGFSFWLIAGGFILAFFEACIIIDALRASLTSLATRFFSKNKSKPTPID